MSLAIHLDLPRDRFHIQIEETLPLDSTWGIMGPSGCGKTSLLRCLAGLERQARGRVQYNGLTWQDSDQGVFVAPEQRRIGYIFQEARLFPHMDVQGNLQFAQARASRKGQGPGWDDVIGQTGIDHLLQRDISKLSGGEKQRVAIARTLLNAPSLLLMDEPLASLDWPSKLALLPCLRNLQQHFGIPVIMVSHGHGELARLADQLLVLEQGRVVDKGHCRALINRTLPQGETLLSVLDATVTRHDPGFPLSELDWAGHTLVVQQLGQAVGQSVRLVLPAHEVSIVLDNSSATSIQNRLPLVIESIRTAVNQQALITLAPGRALDEPSLLAQITSKALKELGLAVGQRVYAQFKATAVGAGS